MSMAGRGVQVETDFGNQRWLASGTGTHPSFNRQSSSGSLTVGGNYRVGKKIGSGNFGELRLGICFSFHVLYTSSACYIDTVYTVSRKKGTIFFFHSF